MSERTQGERLIEAAGIRKRIGDHDILTGAALTVHRGEVVTLIGPNGAGKSTLVRIAMGVMKPDSGTIYRRPGLVIGYLPQRMQPDPTLPLTVARLLALGGGTRESIHRTLEEVGCPNDADKPLQALSGGEFQRVLLARALVRDPDLLVLDEPLQGVDITGQAELYQLIGRLRERYRVGVLMVSHDLHLVMAETDEVICLNKHVCCAGHPEAVSRDPAYVEMFGRAVADSVAVYAHAHDHVHGGEGQVLPIDANGGVHSDRSRADHHHGHGTGNGGHNHG